MRPLSPKVFLLMCLAIVPIGTVAQTTDPETPQQTNTNDANTPIYRAHDRIVTPPLRPNNEDATKAEAQRQSVQVDLSKPLQRTEFQRLVEEATGQPLPIFGADIFANSPSTFLPIDKGQVDPEYIVGPGDEIDIRGWGQVDIDVHGLVDRSGNLFVPHVGNLNVAGLKFKDLRAFIKSAIAKNYQNFDLDVSLGQIRSIQVYVVGHARRPGTYTVSSLNTLVNAVFLAGGPSPVGSMRHIQLKRASQVVTEFDMYDLLMNGDRSKDSTLRAGDVIYIPPVGPTVAVYGSVNVQAIFELRSEKANLDEVLRYAGGVTANASAKKVTVERFEDHAIRSVQELTLDVPAATVSLKDGDLVTVRPLSARFDRAVIIRGNVAYPGRFPWKPGMRITDLIPNREALLTRRFWLRQNNLGRDESGGRTPGPISPSQAAPNPQAQTGTPATGNAMPLPTATTVDALKPALPSEAEPDGVNAQLRHFSSEINWDYAVIERLDHDTLKTKLIPFNLGDALSGKDSEDKVLEDGDVISIFSQSQIKVPELNQSKFVTLEGEFIAPGIYEAEPGETLRALVQRIGGFTPQAFLYGSTLLRESSREEQQKKLDDFVRRLDVDVETNAANRSQNAVSPQDALALGNRLESQRQLVSKFKQIKATGRVVLGTRPGDKDVSSLPEITLEDGDRFYVPRRPSTINVVGAVWEDNSYIYKANHPVSYYLKLAGGGTQGADKRHPFLVRADGSVVSGSAGSGWFTGGFDSMRLVPGDTIVVPEALNKVGILKGLQDWSQVFGQFALGAAAIKVFSQ
jgi:polysaccharide biosynthesis/export protein